MEQSSSTSRVVSLHLSPCGYRSCPNRDVCYHLNKHTSSYRHSFNKWREKFLRKGYLVYDSVFMDYNNNIKPNINYIRWMLNVYKNYNITIPIFFTKYLNRVLLGGIVNDNWVNQIQVTIQSAEDLNYLGNNVQKLFLVKDRETLELAEELCKSKPGKLHLCLDQNFASTDILAKMIALVNNGSSSEVSIDSCAWSWVINSECPFKSEYIDLTWDGTLRKCPFNKEGVRIKDNKLYSEPSDNLIEWMFAEEIPSERCKYKEIFSNRKG